jgi:hypothetical protein
VPCGSVPNVGEGLHEHHLSFLSITERIPVTAMQW